MRKSIQAKTLVRALLLLIVVGVLVWAAYLRYYVMPQTAEKQLGESRDAVRADSGV